MLPIAARRNSRVVTLVTEQDLERRLREHLLGGLLPDAYLYVGRGAGNWRAGHSTGFRVASSLTQLLRQNADSLAPLLPKGLELLSLGVGEGLKERILLEAMGTARCSRTCRWTSASHW